VPVKVAGTSDISPPAHSHPTPPPSQSQKGQVRWMRTYLLTVRFIWLSMHLAPDQGSSCTQSPVGHSPLIRALPPH
jgi:hypothetical protein